MSSADHTTYDIIFVGGSILSNFFNICCADNGFRRGYCLCHCRSSCRGWPFLEDFGKPLEKVWFINISSDSIHISQIVEAGPHTQNLPNHIQPGRFFRSLANKETFSYHVAKPSPSLSDRSAIVATGRALGGGSSVNCMKAILLFSWLMFKTELAILKFLCTQGRRPRITTIGWMCMGIKDGVLRNWYPFSRKLEFLRSTYIAWTY